jgi:hypothetical protein
MKFTYQGVLEIDGQPATGNYQFWGAMYDAQTSGTYQGPCTTTGTNNAFESYVEDGVFTLYLICDGWNSDAFTGDGRWLDLWVAPVGTTDWVQLTDPLQPISPTPYAFSLFPGAVISGTSTGGSFGDSVLNVYDENVVSTWSAVRAETASGSAVRGMSDRGKGLEGYTDDGYGVYGYDGGSEQAKGYGGYFSSLNGVGVYGYSGGTRTHPNIYSPGVYGRSANGVGVYGRSDESTSSWTSAGVLGWGRANPGGKFFTYSGNIIEGWEDEYGNGLSLERRFRVYYTGNVYADGSYNCGLGSGCFNTGTGADVAERIDPSETLEPGSVVEIDPDNTGEFRLSRDAYSKLVVGVISTNPAITMNNNDLSDIDSDERTDDRPLLALVGQVPVRVSAENGPIAPGDLLVSASTPGHAMRGGEDPPAGTVVGKALEGLESGTGVIQMLVLLQ